MSKQYKVVYCMKECPNLKSLHKDLILKLFIYQCFLVMFYTSWCFKLQSFMLTTDIDSNIVPSVGQQLTTRPEVRFIAGLVRAAVGRREHYQIHSILPHFNTLGKLTIHFLYQLFWRCESLSISGLVIYHIFKKRVTLGKLTIYCTNFSENVKVFLYQV